MPMINTIDEHGFPMILADVPNAGVANISPTQESGNDAHDVKSGKFSEKEGVKKDGPDLPANVDPQIYMRHLDAVRDLAREYDQLEAGDIQDFLKGRVQRPLEEAELQQFLQEVRFQRITDLVDVLDNQFRNLIESIKRGRKLVKITAPRGWIRKTFGSLTDDEVISVINRLEARGHKREDLSRSILGRINKPERKEALEQTLSELPSFDEVEGLNLAEYVDLEDESHEDAELIQVFSEMMKQWQPKIEVTVPVTVENKSTTKKVIRDAATGLIEEIKEV